MRLCSYSLLVLLSFPAIVRSGEMKLLLHSDAIDISYKKMLLPDDVEIELQNETNEARLLWLPPTESVGIVLSNSKEQYVLPNVEQYDALHKHLIVDGVWNNVKYMLPLYNMSSMRRHISLRHWMLWEMFMTSPDHKTVKADDALQYVSGTPFRVEIGKKYQLQVWIKTPEGIVDMGKDIATITKSGHRMRGMDIYPLDVKSNKIDVRIIE